MPGADVLEPSPLVSPRLVSAGEGVERAAPKVTCVPPSGRATVPSFTGPVGLVPFRNDERMPGGQAVAGADEPAVGLGAERVEGAAAEVGETRLAERRPFPLLCDALRSPPAAPPARAAAGATLRARRRPGRGRGVRTCGSSIPPLVGAGPVYGARRLGKVRAGREAGQALLAGARRLLRPHPRRRWRWSRSPARSPARAGSSGRPTWRRSPAARSMRDDLPRLLAPPTLPNGPPNPSHIGESRLPRAGADRRRDARPSSERRRTRAAAGRLPRRSSASPRSGPGDGRRRSRSRPGSRRRSRPRRSPKRPPRRRSRRCDAGDRQRRRLLRPARLPARRGNAAGRRRRLRPDGGRGRRPTGIGLSSSPASAPTPNRRRSSPPTPIPAGSRRPATRCIAARPSSTSARAPPTAGSPPTPRRFGFVQRYSWEAWHFGFDRGAAALLGGRQRGRRLGGRRRSPAGQGCPPFVPARFRAPLLRAAAAAGTSRRRCSPRS